jgi:hypothetical protein
MEPLKIGLLDSAPQAISLPLTHSLTYFYVNAVNVHRPAIIVNDQLTFGDAITLPSVSTGISISQLVSQIRMNR